MADATDTRLLVAWGSETTREVCTATEGPRTNTLQARGESSASKRIHARGRSGSASPRGSATRGHSSSRTSRIHDGIQS